MIFKEWLLNLNIWTLWLVDDSIKKQERSYFPPWTQLGNFGSYLSTVAYLMFWMKFYELLDLLPWNLAQTQSEFQNFNFFKCLLKYTHNRAARMLNLPPPLCFFFYPEQNLDVEFQMQKVSTFLFDSSHWYWIHKSCQPTQIFHGHFKRCKRVISPPHHLKKAQQQKWKTAKMTIFSYFKKGTW